MATATPTYDQYAGHWLGSAPPWLGGRIQITVAVEDTATPPAVTFECEAVGRPLGLPEVTLAGGLLVAKTTSFSLRLRRLASSLEATFDSRFLPSLSFTLRRIADNHPVVSQAGLSDAVTTGLGSPEVADLVSQGLIPWLDSLLVLQQGQSLAEGYFAGRGPECLRSLQSVTKSIMALVFGLAVADGRVDLDAPVWRYMKAYPERRWVAEHYETSVHELLSMSAGLEWNEDQTSYSDSTNDNTRMNMADDWVGYVLDKSLRGHRANAQFEYQSGLSLVAGEVIYRATGKTVADLADARIFRPMGISTYYWTASDGVYHTGGGLWMRPRDLSALGSLVLSAGSWEEHQLLDPEWIRLCTSPQSYPLTGEAPVTGMVAYGYQWWLVENEASGRAFRSSSALGHGGQALHTLPDLDLVIAVTSHDWLGRDDLRSELVSHVLNSGLVRM